MRNRSYPRWSGVVGRCLFFTVVAGMLAGGLWSPSHAQPTTRVSVASDGMQSNDGSAAPAISANGRWVAFDSWATNLVPGITGSLRQVYLHDRQTGQTVCVSVASDGTEGDSHSGFPAISADGRFVAFGSYAANLAPVEPGPIAERVYVRDMLSGTTKLVSVCSDGTEGNGYSRRASISADGRFIAFDSLASNLVPNDTNDSSDVFVHDQFLGETTRVSVASDGSEADGYSGYAAISGNGQYVAFESFAENLAPGEGSGCHIFVHSRDTGQTSRASVSSSGVLGNANSYDASISSDGRFVAFGSDADNLVDDDTNQAHDAFVYDRMTAQTVRVSVADDGTEGNGNSGMVSISPDGRYVAFESSADNLVPETTGGHVQILVHDRVTGTMTLASLNADGTAGNSLSVDCSISSYGRHVAFSSFASNLVAGDTNNAEDVFVRDLGTVRIVETGERYLTIQAAINAAMDGQTVEVGPGTYHENINFSGKNITVRSEDPEAPGIVATTIIDGGGTGSVVTFNSGETADAVLAGFTITGGSGTDLGEGIYLGGGIYCVNASPTITANMITGNTAGSAAGIYCGYSDATISGNTIADNTAGSSGGGILSDLGAPTISDNVIDKNKAGFMGGGIASGSFGANITGNTITGNTGRYGGGFAAIAHQTYETSATVSANTIKGNEAEQSGGGVHVFSNERTVGVVLTRNSIVANGAAYSGGGVYSSGVASTDLTGNIITSNESGTSGGGIACAGGTATIAGNTIAFNTAGTLGGGVGIGGTDTSVVITNTIIACSAAGGGIHLWDGAPLPVVSYCNVFGNLNQNYSGMADPTGTDGNISEDPFFADAANGDFHLKSRAERWNPTTETWVTDDVHSPCIDAGDPAAPVGDEPEPNGGRINMGAYGGTHFASKSFYTVLIVETGERYLTIQAAINAAMDGQTVEVGPGTYYENIIWENKDLRLIGAGEGHSIVDGGQAGSCLRMTSVLNTSRLEGFTFTNGHADRGGGLYLLGSSPIITNVTVSGNLAGNGGGLYVDYASPIITNTTISDNSADEHGGGLYVSGSLSDPIINYTTIRENTASERGGGLYIQNYSSPTISNSIISDNAANAYGGGLSVLHSQPIITNSTITGNSTDGIGGGLHVAGTEASPTITNSIIAFSSSGGGIRRASGAVTISYSNVYGNTGGEYMGMADHTGHAGNISADPLFADADNGDFHLRSRGGRWNPATATWVIDDVHSRCIDTGDPATPVGVEPEPNGGRINMGAWGGTQYASKSYYSVRIVETGEGYPSIQAAVNAAANGQTLVAEAGIFYENIIWENKDLRLIGAGEGQSIVDGDAVGSCLRMTDVPNTSLIESFTFTNGDASMSGPLSYGGGLYLINSSPSIANVTVRENSARFGGGLFLESSSPTISDTIISTNSVSVSGGGIYVWGSGASPTITNATISDNSADNRGGGVYAGTWSYPTIISTTISGNSAVEAGGLYHNAATTTITNSIVTFSNSGGGIHRASGSVSIGYSNVHGNVGGDYLEMDDPTGTNGNISADPLFADAEQGDFHLKSMAGRWQPLAEAWVIDSEHSPCIARGDPASDYSNEPEPNGGRVNMGRWGGTQYASKSLMPQPIVYVDGNYGPGLANDGHIWDHTAFNTIQGGIDAVANGGTVNVAVGTYYENLIWQDRDLRLIGAGQGQSIVDGGQAGSCLRMTNVPNTSLIEGFTFTNGLVTGSYPLNTGGGLYLENSSPTIISTIISQNQAVHGGGLCVLQNGSSPTISNTIISDNTAQADGGGLLASNSSPTITNSTISGNEGNRGGGLYVVGAGASPTIINSIIAFSSSGGGIHRASGTVTISYSNVHGNAGGEYLGIADQTGISGNISANPLFADAANGDFHLKSRGGRWHPATETWVIDDVHSRCIDTGDPDAPVGEEPEPNGGRINMGAYGGTEFASKSYFPVRIVETDEAHISIQAAINAAANGQTIEVEEGTYYENLIWQSKDLRLIGAGQGRSIVDGSQAGSCLRMTDVPNTSRIEGFTFTNGRAVGTSPFHIGGGVFLDNSSPTITDITVSGNWARFGGGLGLGNSSPNISNTVISSNTAGTSGGGLYVLGSGSSPNITNTSITGNTAGSDGGGMLVAHSLPTITNSTISGNTAGRDGGGLHVLGAGASPTITNSIIAFSTAGGGIHLESGNPVVSFCNVFGNAGGEYVGMEDPTGIDGNISADPLFADADNGDFHLRSVGGRWNPSTETWVTDDVHSRCIDTGDPATSVGAEPEPNGGRINMGAFGGTQFASKSAPAPTVIAIDPIFGTQDGPVDVAITGAGFLPDATVLLARDEHEEIGASETVVASDTEITCTFDLDGVATGDWHVVVTNYDGQSGRLDEGFRVVASHAVIITAGPVGDPNPVASGGDVACTVTAEDTLGHDLLYAWSAEGDAGNFDDPTAQNPTWTAPENATQEVAEYEITVTVTCADDDGVSDTASYTQRVQPAHSVTITEVPAGDPNPVASGGDVACTVTAEDSLGHDLLYAWSAEGDAGTFDDPKAQTPTWTAPDEAGEYEITVTVTCADDESVSDTALYTQRVQLAHSVTITEVPAGDPNPVASGGDVACTVTAEDTLGHDLLYAWSAEGDAGSFDDATAQNPTWTAPENATQEVQEYEITVTVTCADDDGVSDTASYTQRVTPVHEVTITAGPAGDPNPVVPGGDVTCTVTAEDSLGHDLLYAWSVEGDAGSFDDPTAQNPTWTAPAESGDYEITVVVTCPDDDTVNGRASYMQTVEKVLPVALTSGWSMISLGQPADPALACGDIFDEATVPALYRWDAAGFRYHQLDMPNEPASEHEGCGMWALSREETVGMVPVRAPAPLNVAVSRGWNLLANPYETNFNLQTGLGAVGEGRILLPAFVWNPLVGSYDQLEVVPPGRSFWVLCLYEGQASFDPSGMEPPDEESPVAANLTQAAADVEADPLIQIVAANSGHSDAAVWLGTVDGDALKTPKPPMMPGGVGAYLDVADGIGYARSLRPRADTEAWTLTVNSPADEEKVSIRIFDTSLLPGEMAVWLTDLTTGKRIDLRHAPAYTYIAREGQRRFEIELGERDDLLQVMGVSARPAGDGAQISFTLSAAGAVTVDVLNIAGRTIKRIVADRQCEAGVETVSWNGISDRGTRVPSGLYLVRVTAAAPAGEHCHALTTLQLR